MPRNKRNTITADRLLVMENIDMLVSHLLAHPDLIKEIPLSQWETSHSEKQLVSLYEYFVRFKFYEAERDYLISWMNGNRISLAEYTHIKKREEKEAREQIKHPTDCRATDDCPNVRTRKKKKKADRNANLNERKRIFMPILPFGSGEHIGKSRQCDLGVGAVCMICGVQMGEAVVRQHLKIEHGSRPQKGFNYKIVSNEAEAIAARAKSLKETSPHLYEKEFAKRCDFNVQFIEAVNTCTETINGKPMPVDRSANSEPVKIPRILYIPAGGLNKRR